MRFFNSHFCMRCPEVIVAAVADVISEARKIAKLEGRIEKPYKHFEPVKGKDSKLYPKIWLVEIRCSERMPITLVAS